MYKIIIGRSARKELDRLSPENFHRISRRLKELAGNPRPPGVIKLQGQPGYRLRVGRYRILYEIDDMTCRIIIYRVKHRREAYRNK